MGVIVSSPQASAKKELKRQHTIAEMLIEENKKKRANIFNLLLVGTGDSGKSTVLKQMRILHKNGFQNDELIAQRSMVSWNVVHSIATIIKAMDNLEIKFDQPELEVDADRIINLESDWKCADALVSHPDWMRIKRLWADAGVQTCFERSNEYQLSDSTKYFCNDIDRISNASYLPTEQDILRIPTTSIIEVEFSVKGMQLNIIDVGGQRSERRKWIHLFENVNALIFIVAASSYNQVLEEDKSVNRLQEALALFGTIINSIWFQKSQLILFFNKKDLFQERITAYPLTIAFPDYSASWNDYEEAMTFMQNKFDSQKKDAKKIVYTHRTCATDTKNVEFVMNACFDMLFNKQLGGYYAE